MRALPCLPSPFTLPYRTLPHLTVPYRTTPSSGFTRGWWTRRTSCGSKTTSPTSTSSLWRTGRASTRTATWTRPWRMPVTHTPSCTTTQTASSAAFDWLNTALRGGKGKGGWLVGWFTIIRTVDVFDLASLETRWRQDEYHRGVLSQEKKQTRARSQASTAAGGGGCAESFLRACVHADELDFDLFQSEERPENSRGRQPQQPRKTSCLFFLAVVASIFFRRAFRVVVVVVVVRGVLLFPLFCSL